MSVVPLNEVWVDANFKEGQLRNLRIGQPVDAAGRRLRQEGRLPRQGRGPRRRHRRGVRAAAGAERHRQLDQGRAARAGAHRARPEGARRSIRCASACRWTRRSTSATTERPRARRRAAHARRRASHDHRVRLAATTRADAEVTKIIAANVRPAASSDAGRGARRRGAPRASAPPHRAQRAGHRRRALPWPRRRTASDAPAARGAAPAPQRRRDRAAAAAARSCSARSRCRWRRS